MIFVFKAWERFCAKLSSGGIKSIPAYQVIEDRKTYVVLKHDVETDVSKAFKLASIEHRYGHCGTYYVQAYLLSQEKNIQLLKEMQAMGHEISYHYDVMDSNKGDIAKAMAEFEKNRALFEENGFFVKTVCQHGNPVVERIGYTSNRDFFRNAEVQKRYPDISDIMVNYAEKVPTKYLYFSDAGRKFKRIYDPINNDVIPSDDKNVPYDNLEQVYQNLALDQGNIISTHPHRWTKSAIKYTVKTVIFKIVKCIAKLMMKVPFLKKFMSRYYYLAKKI